MKRNHNTDGTRSRGLGISGDREASIEPTTPVAASSAAGDRWLPSNYARAVLDRMRPADRSRREHLTFRELGRRIGVSYEHIRRIAHGEVTFGRSVNDAICKELGLSTDHMWALAQREKLLKRFGEAGEVATLLACWEGLNDGQRQALISVARAMSIQRSPLSP
jgi:transcriptional regulator with XRE-family HTH domain